MKKIILQLLLYTVLSLTMINTALAGTDNVIISQVLYDPTSQIGKEAVELYNPTQNEIDISGWHIDTSRYKKDATIPDGTTLSAGSHYLIADRGWSTAKEQSWPEADHEQDISLSNNNAGVALKSGNQTIDAAGWGEAANLDSQFYEGTPHSGVSKGKSLLRKSQSGSYVDTENNANDFIESDPSFGTTGPEADSEPSNGNGGGTSGQIRVVAVIGSSGPVISSMNLTDHDSIKNGAQVNPAPKQNRTVEVQAVVNHSSGRSYLDSAVLIFKGKSYNMTPTPIDSASSRYTASFNISHDTAKGNYQVTVTATDKSRSKVNRTETFEYTELVAMELDTESLRFEAIPGMTTEIAGDSNEETDKNMTLKNIGNSPLNIQMAGTNLISGSGVIAVSNIQYTFNRNYTSALSGRLSERAQTKPLGVQIAGTAPVSFMLTVPTGTRPGNYNGTITLIAVKP